MKIPKLSSDPNEDKARKAAAALALLGLYGLGRSQFDPQAWAVSGGGSTFCKKLEMPGGSWFPPGSSPISQCLINGGNNDIGADYGGISHATYTSSTEYHWQHYMPSSGKLSKLHFRLVTAPGAGCWRQIIIRKNGVDTGLVVRISDADTRGCDLVNEVDYVATDLISAKFSVYGAAAVTKGGWHLEAEDTLPERTIILGGGQFTIAGTRFDLLQGANANSMPVSVESEADAIIPTPCTLKELYVIQDRTSGGGYSYTVRKNAANTALALSITGAAVAGSNLVDEVHFNAGDRCCMRVSPLPATQYPRSHWGLVLVPDIAGEAVIMGGLSVNMVAGTYFIAPPAPGYSSSTHSWQLIGKKKLKKWFIRLSAPPGAGKSLVFSIYKNGVNTGFDVIISDLETTGSNTGDVIDFDDYDRINMIVTAPAGPPAALTAHWGLVQVKA